MRRPSIKKSLAYARKTDAKSEKDISHGMNIVIVIIIETSNKVVHGSLEKFDAKYAGIF